MTGEKQILLERAEIDRLVHRMAREIVEKAASPSDLVIIGIRSRGVFLARRLARKIEEAVQVSLPLGVLDVTSFRDDRAQDRALSAASAFEIPVKVDGKTVLLIDDVIFRGRTVRAAMEAVERLGEPKKIFVAALIDRGARELPIRADIVGKNIEAGDHQRVNVWLEESDGIDQVTIADWHERGTG
ncbi:MAG TPA: bifunctional pyr operon transcriptional regulator/uracil phosphoribosyltransferase PyrR [Candidatus Limnocylindria bacterium]|nr:bifunctional pyr operon transcriptional regulator/uracil phosphoribosyltransferase PyrR [Candidatus Limnocylindria bacterium]